MLSLKPFLRSKHGKFFAIAFLLAALLLAAAACDNGSGVISCGCGSGGITPCTCGCEPFAGDEPPGVEPLKLGYEMARIPAGTFTMGSPADEPKNNLWSTNETQHEVTLTKAFDIGKHEITQAQYEKVMGEESFSYYSAATHPYEDGQEEGSRPVECINWYEVIVFCNTLSMREGFTPAYSIDGKTDPAEWGSLPRRRDAKWDAVVWNKDANGYRLPTEAEWEYACRAGTTTAYWSGAGDTSLDGNANICDNSFLADEPIMGKELGATNITDGYGDITAPVKTFAPNPWGLYDMHGNVAEWCWDWYAHFNSNPQTDPSGPPTGNERIVRGGSFIRAAKSVRSAVRTDSDPPTMSHTALGFRLARFP